MSKRLTKAEMALMITSSPAWDGCSEKELIKNYTRDFIEDLYNELPFAEEEYFDTIYQR